MSVNPIQFHLSYNNGAERLWLPVSPPSIRIGSTHGYQDVEAAQLGEYTIIGKRKSDTYSFASFFPRDYNASYCSYADLPDPWDCVKSIDKWMRSGNPMRLTVAGTPINAAVTVRQFDYEPERGGAPGDIYYSLSFKEYVFVGTRKISFAPEGEVASVSAVSEARPDTETQPTTYTVIDGDSLWKIAQRVYYNGDLWRKIYDANRQVIGLNPNLIYPNQQLVVPA